MQADFCPDYIPEILMPHKLTLQKVELAFYPQIHSCTIASQITSLPVQVKPRLDK